MLMFYYANLHPAYGRLMTFSKVSKDKNIEIMQKFADKVSDLWLIVEKHLEKNDFMFGNEPTIIDYLITLYTKWDRYMPEVNIKIGDNVRKLANTFSQTPEFIRGCEKKNLKCLDF